MWTVHCAQPVRLHSIFDLTGRVHLVDAAAVLLAQDFRNKTSPQIRVPEGACRQRRSERLLVRQASLWLLYAGNKPTTPQRLQMGPETIRRKQRGCLRYH